MKLIFLLSLSVIVNTLSFSQHYHVNHYDFDESKSNDKKQFISFDQDGMIYMITSRNIYRFDGKDYKDLNTPDSIFVTCFLHDTLDTYWIGTRFGEIYKWEDDQWGLWEIEEGRIKSKITRIEKLSNGNYAISTYGEGLYIWDREHLYNFNQDDGLLSEDIYDLVVDRRDYIWLATDAGVFRCTFDNGRKSIKKYGKEQGLFDEIVLSLSLTEEGRLLAGTFDGYIFSIDDNTVEALLAEPLKAPVYKLAKDPEQNIWMDIGHQKLQVLDKNGHMNLIDDVTYPYGLNIDVQGNLWVLDRLRGLTYIQTRVRHYYFEGKSIQTLLFSKQDDLMIGTLDGLYIYKVNDNYKEGHRILSDVNVISLYQDERQNVWIGTFGQGLYVMNWRTKRIKRFGKADGLINESILSIDGRGDRIWLASLGGLTKLKQKTFPTRGLGDLQHFGLEQGIQTTFNYKIFIDHDDVTWVGTDGKGLERLGPEGVSHYQFVDSMELHSVLGIVQDANRDIWFTTDRSDIYKYDGTQFQQVMPGRITGRDITNIISNDNEIVLAGRELIEIIRDDGQYYNRYDDRAGMEEFIPNINAHAKDKYGDIWIGGDGRVVNFQTTTKTQLTYPPTILKSVHVFGEELNKYENGRLQFDNNSLLFDFINPWYVNPDHVNYRYRLRGLSDQWVYTDLEQANYHRLPPSRYKFEVQSAPYAHFSVDSRSTTYAFEISKPYYLTWWFIVLSIMTIAGLIYAYVLWREKQQAEISALERSQVVAQLETIKSQINPHFLFNSFNSLISIIEDDQKDAVEFVQNLSDFYRSILRYRDTELIRLEEEIEIVNKYIFILKKRFEDSLQLSILVEHMDFKIAPLTLLTLIENAVKHNMVSTKRPLNVKIEEVKNSIWVSNNLQKKNVKMPSTSYGLSSIKKRYELLGVQSVKIEEGPSEFKVKIPLIK